MDEPEWNESEERQVTFIAGDTRLEIVANKVGCNEWSLSVMNDRGVFSTWCEFFESADFAIAAALQAIQEEGIQEFTSIEGFEYLDGKYENV